MPVKPRSLLKQWFETGDFPTQSQFWDWIDSYFHKGEDRIAFNNLTPELRADINNAQGYPITLDPGTTDWMPENDMVIQEILVLPDVPIDFTMGTTLGGEEKWPSTHLDPGAPDNLLLSGSFRVYAGQSYFFGGVTPATVIKIKKW